MYRFTDIVDRKGYKIAVTSFAMDYKTSSGTYYVHYVRYC